MAKHQRSEHLYSVADVPEEVARYLLAARAPGTLRAYRRVSETFRAWCSEKGRDATAPTPIVIAEWLASLASVRRFSTVKWHLVGIVYCYRQTGFEIDTRARVLRDTLQGIERVIKQREKRSAAIMLDDLKKLLATCDDRPLGVRDRAILLIGFAGAFRRSEIVSLDVKHLIWGNDRLTITVERSKEDQKGRGEAVVLAYGKDPQTCPIIALKAWVSLARITKGALFLGLRKSGRVTDQRLSDKGVDRIVKRRAELAGIVIPEDRGLSSHGLRAGFITEAYKAGISDEEIMGHTRHRHPSSMRGYVRRERLNGDTPAAMVGL